MLTRIHGASDDVEEVLGAVLTSDEIKALEREMVAEKRGRGGSWPLGTGRSRCGGGRVAAARGRDRPC